MSRFSFKAPTVQPPVLRLSVEEEAIADDELSESGIELEKTSADIDRLDDIVITMNDVQVVISNTPEIKPIDQALVAAVGDMAVAGTDADSEGAVANMLLQNTPSTEGFFSSVKDKLSEMWQKICELMKKMWHRVEEFFGLRTKRAEKMGENVKEVDEGVKKLRDRGFKSQADFDAWVKRIEQDTLRSLPSYYFHGDAFHLTLHGKVVDPKHLAQELTKLHNYASGAVDSIIDTGIEATSLMIDIVKRCVSHPADTRKTMDDSFGKYANLMEKLFQKLGAGHQPELMGGFAIKSTTSSTAGQGGSTKVLYPEFEQKFGHLSSDKIEALPVEELNATNAAVLKWVEFSKSTVTDNGRRRLVELSDTLRNEIDKLDKARHQVDRESSERAKAPSNGDATDDFKKLAGQIHDSGLSSTMWELAYQARDLAHMGSGTLIRIIDHADKIFKNAAKWSSSSFDHYEDIADHEERHKNNVAYRKENGHNDYRHRSDVPLKNIKDVDDYFTK